MAANAYAYALNLLAAQAYTVRNLRRKLSQKEFDPAEADRAIERLQANGYLDDEKYAVEYARQKLVAGGAAVRRVQQDLIKRGVSPASAKTATGAVVAEEEVDFGAAI